MATIKKFEDIQAWQKGRELKQAVYRCSKRGEFTKDFALRDQIRRAAISVTANIAEVAKLTGSFMSYLRQTEVRGQKFRDARE